MERTKPTKSPKKAARKKKPRPRRVKAGDFITDSIDASRAGAKRGKAPAEKPSLGERIREAREMRELTLEDLSSRTGISVEMLERVEAGQATPPLGALVRVGKALETQMGYFISGAADQSMCVVRAESRPKVARRTQKAAEQYGYVYESLAPEKANRLMEPFLVTMTPTEFGEMSSHDGQEFIFVLEGEISVGVDEEAEVLRAGDSVYYDSSHPHLVKCHGKEPAKILAMIYAGDK
jgi:quercetin dioxygenase-like cupin family protein/ribosome-binding protein aMBF1 (putative translation factor)